MYSPIWQIAHYRYDRVGRPILSRALLIMMYRYMMSVGADTLLPPLTDEAQ